MSRENSRELSATSFAILGLLALKRWSTYELAKQMRRTFHYFWPRAESNLYVEPKKLVAHGLARAEAEPHGKRRRTVYSITPAGRRALTAWLAEPPGPPRYESEALVKVIFANYGTREDLLRTLHKFRDDSSERREELRAIFERYVEGDDPYPDRTHVNALGSRLSLFVAAVEIDWANWAIAEVERWQDISRPEDRQRSLEIIRGSLDALEAASELDGTRRSTGPSPRP